MAQTTAAPTRRPRYVAASNVRTLAVDANIAREAYTLATLQALARHGTLRAQGVARSVFPTRSAVAGHSAAKRVLKGCVEQKLAKAQRKPGAQHIYYALTRTGAALVNEQAPARVPAQDTTKLLRGDMSKAVHREWTAAIVEAAGNREGLESFGELEIQRLPGAVSSTLIGDRFKGQHMPDALTFHRESRTVVWHEVELSRRSQWAPEFLKREQDKEREKAKSEKRSPREVRSGQMQLEHLLRTLRTARVLARGGIEYQVMLVAHCGNELIRREFSRVVERAFPRDNFEKFPAKLEVLDPGRHYRVNWNASERFGFFEILLQDLPAEDPGEVSIYSADLLWPDAPQELREKEISEKFLAN